MASKEGWVKWPFLKKKKNYQTVAEEKNGNRKI